MERSRVAAINAAVFTAAIRIQAVAKPMSGLSLRLRIVWVRSWKNFVVGSASSSGIPIFIALQMNLLEAIRRIGRRAARGK